jgi:phosphoribosyl-ATP pyrophosphohydrolase
MKIEEMSEVELKSMCYDQLVILEQTQMNIKIIQQELQKRSQPKEIVKE